MQVSEPNKILDVLTDCFFGIYGYWDNTPDGICMLGLDVDPPRIWKQNRHNFVKSKLERYANNLNDPFSKRLIAYLPNDRWLRLPCGVKAKRIVS
jgi:hypothetical protein